MTRSATFLAVLLAAAPVAAQDQQLGARTKGMGGSYTAFEDDPVSIWLNPAGIASQPDQLSISYQTYTTYPLKRDVSQSTIGTSADAETTFVDPAFIPSYLGVVFQVGAGDSPMALGICYARPYHLNYSFDQVDDPMQTTFSPDTNVEESFSRFRVALGKGFRLRSGEDAKWFTRLSAGVGVDIGYEEWEFSSPTATESDNSTALGYGAGLLTAVYDNTTDLKVNLGLAYQSGIHWDFSNDPSLFPAFDMPQQFNVGVTGYVMEGFPLRMTLDVQWVEWSATAERPAFPGQNEFEDAVNFSLGTEYRIAVDDRVSVYPRLGYRRFNAPWEDADDLPMTSRFKLLLDTKSGTFNIFTFGAGISFPDKSGKIWAVDLGADVGGDTFNVALGLTLEI